jgi:hypothetical protein
MPAFVVLGNFTEQGIRDIKNLPRLRQADDTPRAERRWIPFLLLHLWLDRGSARATGAIVTCRPTRSGSPRLPAQC